MIADETVLVAQLMGFVTGGQTASPMRPVIVS